MKSVSFYIKHINRTQVISAVILVALLAAGWFFFFRGAAGTEGFLTLEYKPFIQQVSVSGKVVAAKEVDLGFSQSGRITLVYVSVGNYVSQGTTLAVVENGDQRAALLQREAALENQQAKLAALKAGTRPEEIAVAQSSVASDMQALIDELQDTYRAADGATRNTLDQFISNPRTSPSLTFSVSDSNLKTSVESKRLFRGAAGTDGLLVLELKPFIQQVSVSGKVIAAKEVDLGFSQSGRITGVYVSVGNYVSQGTTLAVVENGDLRATLLQREAALENQQAKLASLKAGTRPEEMAVAQSSVTRDTQALIDELQDAYRAADGATRNTLDQFISNPRTSPSLTFSVSDSNLKTSVESKRLAAESALVAWSGAVFALGASADLSQAASLAQSNLSAIVSLLSDAGAAINRAIPSTQIPQATLDDYSAAVATARTNINASISAVTSAKSDLDASRKNLALKEAGSTPQDISAGEAQVKSAAADVAAAAAQLSKTFISAPFSGIITVVDAKAGKIVSPNTPEISMISTGAFQIESYVPEINIALIAVRDKASVTLDAYGEKIFPASVVSIDPAETVRDGVSTYRAMLQFDAQNPLIKSGMTANVAITTDTKESALAVPQGLVVYRDGKMFVRVLVDKSTVEREVTLGGVSSLGEVEILSGLKEGDTIITTLP